MVGGQERGTRKGDLEAQQYGLAVAFHNLLNKAVFQAHPLVSLQNVHFPCNHGDPASASNLPKL